ncbi:COMM domain-containing protein 3-like [Rhopilema esculentum]|uniref:COMM domain-containing protein 3-like n=1 Tax=Rhopilema esculentum TaxID=499914 RepID=UPI0031E195D5
MEISPEAMEGVKLLGDSSSVPDAIFGSVTENAFKFAAGRNCEKNTEVPGIDAGFMKQCTYGILTAIYEGAKSAGDVSMIRAALEDYKWIPERITFFLQNLKEYKDEIRIQISRIGTSYPHIIDIDWRLDYFIKSNQMEKINEPQYLLSLKTQDNDVTSVDVVNISCSVDELQDLVGKLKDAAKVLEKATQG